MRYLLTSAGEKALKAWCHPKTIFAFDYDGTLSKITTRPTQTALTSKTSQLLRTLSEQVCVAIITGRSQKDIRSRIPFKIPYFIGNHGLEGLGLNQKKLKQLKSISSHWNEKLISTFKKTHPIPGLEIEDKAYTLSVHYRNVQNKKLTRDKILHFIETLNPKPHLIGGKYVFNLIPHNAPNKGTALLEIMRKEKAPYAFFIGDDVTDEDVFLLSDPRIFSVRVGKSTTSAATYYLKTQSEITHLLELLLQFVKMN